MTNSATTLDDASPEEGARRVAIAYVAEAREAAARLLAGGDSESLHDLRVALRRLRSVMRFFDHELRESVKKKVKRRLRTVARATGEGRDAEVQLAWIEAQLSRDDWTERAGARWWATSLRASKERAYETLEQELVPELEKMLPALALSLSHFREERSLSESTPRPRFGQQVASHLAKETAELAAALSAVKGLGDEAIAHQARIHGKRIRYLVEPFKNELEEAREAARILKGLQEKLGELNDLAVRTVALPVRLARGIVHYRNQRFGEARRELGTATDRRNGSYALRAFNHLRAAFADDPAEQRP